MNTLQENSMSTLNHMSVPELQRRWHTDTTFQNFRKAVLLNDTDETWFRNLPKIGHSWEKDEVGDFRGVFFDHMDLVEIDLTSLRLDHANFSSSNLRECSFQGTELSDASFEGAHLIRAHTIPIYGERVNFSKALLNKSALEYSKLPTSNFVSTTLDEVSLSHADVTGSSLVGAQFKTCRLDSCALRETDLSDANFVDCNLIWAVLQSAQMSGTVLQNCDMSGTDFRGTSLGRAKIHGGKFGVVQQGGAFTPTRFDDTVEARRLVADSGAEGIDSIEWLPVGMMKDATPKNVAAGQRCPRNGFWFTPAQAGSRQYFQAAQTFPEVNSAYGMTIWQWDQNQDPPKL